MNKKYSLGNGIFAFLSLLFFSLQLFAQPSGASPGLTSLPNMRDLGGYKTIDSSVIRRGQLYRSSQLYRISKEDIQKLTALKLKTDFDLRTGRERAAKPDELPAGVSLVALDMLADAREEAFVKLDELMSNPRRVSSVAGGGTAEAIQAMKQIYIDLVTLPSAKNALKEFFLKLAQSGTAPAVFHCSSGKDRTGWATAVLLTLLGIPKETILKDFVKSNDYILPAQKKVIDDFVKAGGEPGIMPAILGVKAEYLEASFNEVQSTYGSMDRYFTEVLGIDAVKQKKIKELFLEKK